MKFHIILEPPRSSEAGDGGENDGEAEREEEEEAARSFEVRFKGGAAIGGRMLGAARPRCNTDIREGGCECLKISFSHIMHTNNNVTVMIRYFDTFFELNSVTKSNLSK